MNKERVVLATRNRGKLAEFGKLLASSGIEIVGLDDFAEIGEIAETGTTFAENALLKARHAASATGLIALADDSGLVVDALCGAPGIYSARYGADWQSLPGESIDQRNMRKLLHEMRAIPAPERGCHFETAIAAVAPTGEELVTTGQWPGFVLLAPQGENGFGYDPVFFDPQSGKSAAELSPAAKNAVSHRSRALAQLLQQWPDFMAHCQRKIQP